MKTMTAFWRYDWQRNASRHLALAALAAAWPWAMTFGRAGVDDGRWWTPVLLTVGVALGVAIPLLFMGNIIEEGRVASPREFRHFVHVLPVDRKEWALAKLASAGLWVGIVPTLLLFGTGLALHLLQGGHPTGGLAKVVGVLQLLATLSAFTVWTMLWAALFPHRWVLLGIPLFVLGEGLARGITSAEALVSSIPRTLLASGLDMGLLVVLAGLLAVVFVLYHQRRSRGWALATGFFVLVGVDGLRAVVGWLIRTRL